MNPRDESGLEVKVRTMRNRKRRRRRANDEFMEMTSPEGLMRAIHKELVGGGRTMDPDEALEYLETTSKRHVIDDLTYDNDMLQKYEDTIRGRYDELMEGVKSELREGRRPMANRRASRIEVGDIVEIVSHPKHPTDHKKMGYPYEVVDIDGDLATLARADMSSRPVSDTKYFLEQLEKKEDSRYASHKRELCAECRRKQSANKGKMWELAIQFMDKGYSKREFLDTAEEQWEEAQEFGHSKDKDWV